MGQRAGPGDFRGVLKISATSAGARLTLMCGVGACRKARCGEPHEARPVRGQPGRKDRSGGEGFIGLEERMHRIALVGVVAAFALALLAGVAVADTKAPGPLGLPSVEVLKEKLTLTAAQEKKVVSIYEEFKDKAKDVEEKGDAEKKAEVRNEIVSKIKEICSSDQKQMLDRLVTENPKK